MQFFLQEHIFDPHQGLGPHKLGDRPKSYGLKQELHMAEVKVLEIVMALWRPAVHLSQVWMKDEPHPLPGRRFMTRTMSNFAKPVANQIDVQPGNKRVLILF